MSSVKSHARVGLMCTINALCNPSILQHLISCRRLLLNLGVPVILEIFMSFTIVTAMIITAFAASLARDSDANQNGFGAWSSARDRRYTIGDHRCPPVVRMVLNAIAKPKWGR